MSNPIQEAAERRRKALQEVNSEMEHQISKWGIQTWPNYQREDVIASTGATGIVEVAKQIADDRMASRELSWLDIMCEEFLEAREEAVTGNLEALREELIQVAAVALSWVGSIDREAINPS